MRRLKHTARAGFTMIEVMISLGILTSLLLLSAMVSNSSRGAYGQATTAADLVAEAKLVVDRVAIELQIASTGTFNPELNAGVRNTSSLTFQQLVDIVGGAPVYGGPDPNEVMSLQLLYANGELDDGIDNNGDGLADERQLVLTRNIGAGSQVSTTLCSNISEFLEGEFVGGGDENGNGLVDEAGFDIERNGDVLTIRLSVEGQNSRGETMVRTVETAVRLRN